MLTRIPARHIYGLDEGPHLKPIPLHLPIVGWVGGPVSYANLKTPAICGVCWGPAFYINPITPAFVGWVGAPPHLTLILTRLHLWDGLRASNLSLTTPGATTSIIQGPLGHA